MYLISLLWRYTGELIRPKGSMERLSRCLAFPPSSGNYNVNDWVVKETLLGRILNSACAALCTWESLQTLSQFLISSVQKIGPYYTALSESLIIIFVRAALFISRSVSSDCKLYSPCSKSLWLRSLLLLIGSEPLFFPFSPMLLSSSSLSLSGSKSYKATRCSPSLSVLSISQTN